MPGEDLAQSSQGHQGEGRAEADPNDGGELEVELLEREPQTVTTPKSASTA